MEKFSHLSSPVSHQLGLAIRRDEADRVLGLELGELHTPGGRDESRSNIYLHIYLLLVKLAVIYSYSRLGFGLFSRLALAVHGNLVVDAKLALWHARQVGLHQDLPGYVSGENLPGNTLFKN